MTESEKQKEITEWATRFKVFLKANPDAWRMMRRGQRPAATPAEYDLTTAQEIAWFVYLDSKGMRHRASAWRSALSRGVSVMVPCEDPSVFYLNYY